MKKTKIGQGYYKSGYGKGFNPHPVVWNIEGKAYVKDSNSLPYETDLSGWIMVNPMNSANNETKFYAVGLITEHLTLSTIK